MPQRAFERSWRASERVERARVLALLNLIGGLVLVNGGWFSSVPGAPVTLYRVLVAVGILEAVLLFVAARRVPSWALNLLLAFYSLMIGILAFVAARDMAIAALGPTVIVVGMYAGYFLSVRSMIAQVSLAVGFYVVGAVLSRPYIRPMDLLTTVLATVSVTWVLATMTRRLRRSNSLDALTGVLVRSSWVPAAQWMLGARPVGESALVVLDLDHFKRVNDDEGHPAGDALLRSAAQAWGAIAAGRGWLLGRYGGDEFVLLIGGGRAAALKAVSALRAAHPVSFTAGIAVTSAGVTTVEQLVEEADRVLISQKRERADSS